MMTADQAARDARSRGTFAGLCAIGFLAYCSYSICRAPLLPLLARDLGADAPMVGFVMAASTLTGVVLKLPAGVWSDVFGRRPLLVAGTVVFATMPFMYLAVSSLAVLVAIRFLHGSATAIVGPVASASLSDLAPAARRATWLATYSTFQGAGQTLGPVIAGYVIAGGRYDVAFAAAGLFAAATPFIAARWPLAPPAVARPDRAGQFTHAIVEVCQQPLILMTSLAQAAQFVLNGTLNAFLPLFARDTLGLSPSGLGWLFALQTVTTLTIRPVIGLLSDRIGRRGVITTGLTLCSGAVLVIAAASALGGLVTGVFLYAVGVAVTTAATSAYITDLSRQARYGSAHGVFGTIYDVGDALGPIAAGLLVASVGYTRMFQVMAAVALFVTATFYVVSRRTDPARTAKEVPVRMTALVFIACIAGGTMAAAETRKRDFTDDAVGQPPKGFVFGHTAKVGAPGTWVVQAEGPNRFLAQTNADSTRSRFPVAVLSDVTATDVDLSVRFKPVSGRVDQAAGLVWRYRDEDNYYIVRANALEDNVVVYKVENGKRTDLPLKGEGRTYGKKAEVPAGQWSTLRVVANGPHVEVHFNGTKLYDVEDNTFTQAGRVGVWTKADSVTHFDDLTVVTK